MTGKRASSLRLSHLSIPLFLLLLCTACGQVGQPVTRAPAHDAVYPARMALAVEQAAEMKSAGQRLWCVPFARNASGVEIKGNAGTWWSKAKGVFPRSHAPEVGAVMAFKATRKLPMGHVAVVSKVVSDRSILIDHANWSRNKVSLGMAVVDISKNNDWSQVRVESQPGTFGFPYAIDGFITLPTQNGKPVGPGEAALQQASAQVPAAG